MSEPRIAIKIAHGRFVTCYPMPPQRPDEVTFPQHLISSNLERITRFRRTPNDHDNYVATREDQSA